MKVVVDEDRCRGHGMCLTLCSDVFSMTDDGYAVAEPAEVAADLEVAVRDAMANCPEQAIVETND
ncbi:ferredoxin [Mycolicibacterium sp. CBMA 226]|uniref:ferredoxin n=1 Tax=Mycolicibacterium sp. CBMA 226 TaxID=2606611 RepID=UPI0012DC55B1|nr:ferredoxin [Mycolicibacterium sp. CBMA 226]MUL75815.1 ferredoxin [Mycolicibacterium sp. CBMA 226]